MRSRRGQDIKVVKLPLHGRSPLGGEIKRVWDIQRPLMPAYSLYLCDPSSPAGRGKELSPIEKALLARTFPACATQSSLEPCEISH